MSSPTPETTLRALFEELSEIAPEQRRARFESLRLPEEMRTSLEAMLTFDELTELAPESCDARIEALKLPEEVSLRVRTMLAAHHRWRSPFGKEVAGFFERVPTGEGDLLGQSLVGTCIGSFRLTGFVGQGGSSVVLRAERDVGTGTQVVALKLLRTGLYSADAQRRFRREQAILAQLTHPNIARLIEGGVSSSGIPYIAMELVDGVPITTAADSRGLNLEQRLVWFSTLCRTIEAAHASLIVHRDLKPSNVFVTRAGDLKVLDFGIAKLVDSNEVQATRTQSIVLTPEYAAPEQYGTAPVTTAVDVYALGIVLGELLTGKRLAGRLRASSEIAAAKNTDPPLPRGLPQRNVLARRLRNDLDAILANAIAEEPSMRYRSAGAFADDIDRHLAGLPVRAHPPSRWYRARKFAVRHRNIMLATTLLTCGILVSLALAIWQRSEARNAAQAAQAQAARARDEAMRATSEEGRATAATAFLISLFQESDPSINHGARLTANEILERGAYKVKHDFAMQPELRARLLVVIGEVYSAIGDLRGAEPLLEQAVTELNALQTSDAFELGHVLRVLARAAHLRGDFAKAIKLLDEAQSRLESSISPRAPDELILVIGGRAGTRLDAGDGDGARREFAEVIDYAHRIERPDSPAMARVHNDYGRLLGFYQADKKGARDEYEQALAIYRRESGDDSVDSMTTISNLGFMLTEMGELDTARGILEKVASKQLVILGENNGAYADTQTNLGFLEFKQNRFDQAMDHYEIAERIFSSVLGDPNYGVAYCAASKGDVESARGNYALAEGQYDRALDLYRATTAADHPELMEAFNGRSRALLLLGKYEQARADAESALTIGRAKLAPDHPWTVGSLLNLGLALRSLGDTTGARMALDEARERGPRAYIYDHKALADLEKAVSDAYATPERRASH
jgi:serine/threonine-protein kinase